MWFSVWTVLATGGGGGGGAALVVLLAALSSALRNVLITKKRANTNFLINRPFASGRAETDGLYHQNGDDSHASSVAREGRLSRWRGYFFIAAWGACGLGRV